jgi:hypothetical protein
MRPVRVTGITGTSPVVPLDVYATSQGTAAYETAAAGAQMQVTYDDVFNAAITPVWINLGAVLASASIAVAIPYGARGIRATGMISADVLEVSQQSTV